LHTSKSPSRRSKTPNNSCSRRVSTSSQGGCAGGRPEGADRFIPNRSTTDLEAAQHSLVADPSLATAEQRQLSLGEVERRRALQENLNPAASSKDRILSFKTKAPHPRDGHLNNMKVLYSSGKPSAPKASNTRQVASSPEKILDAPDMLNDFYLHLMDWSSSNLMAVALSGGVYIWSAGDGNIVQLCSREGEDEYVSSVSWLPGEQAGGAGGVLGVGSSTGNIQLWDVGQSKLVRSMAGHTDRVGCLAWNNHLLASGGREGAVLLHDVRVARHQVASLASHTQEVCGLHWSHDGKLLASGGNDNSVAVWDTTASLGAPGSGSRPLHTITSHQSAVKAVSWCPWQHQVLATAGGTVDRTIRVWNTQGGRCTQIHSLDTGSQVSSIVWNSEYRELVTGHGFSHNQLTIWKYPGLTKVADLTGHTSRVLLLALSPDRSTVASAAADETIRLWKIWPVDTLRKKEESRGKKHPVSMLAQSIR